jgi:hypothetical protein
MAGMWSNQSIIPTFDVSAKTAEPKMAFNFAHLLSAACGGAARRLRALRARFFSLFLSFSPCNFTEKGNFSQLRDKFSRSDSLKDKRVDGWGVIAGERQR